jgi:hypothetical protein
MIDKYYEILMRNIEGEHAESVKKAIKTIVDCCCIQKVDLMIALLGCMPMDCGHCVHYIELHNDKGKCFLTDRRVREWHEKDCSSFKRSR